ncbi:hypothetical protein GCM10011505_14190 [Tistrella bauzanensis]|uniref:Cytochrome c-type biogenesis protein CcmE n=1 Tax=Tistrella bauzanensis TaxID=657419 RepID=A0ABQ1ID39_9PROT|nr:hypothetical protein GCM10011505_14190 [Tistrella bauzanensis]
MSPAPDRSASADLPPRRPVSGTPPRRFTRKRRRMYALGGILALVAVALALVLGAFRDNLLFFYSPSDIIAKQVEPGTRLRVGGLVEAGSVARGPGTNVAFVVTDGAETLTIRYDGLLPDLFREGQGIVAEGRFEPDGTVTAEQVLAKHDETYMPPEVVDAMKRAGTWKGDGAAAGDHQGLMKPADGEAPR